MKAPSSTRAVMTVNNSSVVTSGDTSTLEVVAQYHDISTETRKVVETICFVGLIPLACLFGIPANVVNCLVFCRQGLRDRMNLCLFSLSLTDFFLLVCAFTIHSVGSFLAFYDVNLGEEYFIKTLASLLGTMYGLRLTSGCISMIIALERCMCVIFPLRAATLMKTKTMVCLVCFSLLIFQGFYFVFLFSIRASFVKKDNTFQWMLVHNQFYEENKTVIQPLLNIALGTVVPFATFATVFVATIITVVRLKANIEWRQRSSFTRGDNNSRQMALTSMLVAVSCVYIITMVPFVIWQTVRVVLQDLFTFDHLYNVYMVTNALVNACPLVNSSVYFFVYYLRSSRFRQVFFDVWHCSKPIHLSSKTCKRTDQQITIKNLKDI